MNDDITPEEREQIEIITKYNCISHPEWSKSDQDILNMIEGWKEPLKLIDQEQNEEVIRVLEGMLQEAKDGKLRSLVAVKLFYGDGGSGQAWAGLDPNDVPKLLGEILMMASRLSNHVDGVEADDIRY